jgi:multiple sugar transport system substrate-binding protein
MVNPVTRRRLAGASILLATAAGTAACATSGGQAVPLRIDRPVNVTLLVSGTFAGPGADAVREAYETYFKPEQPNVAVTFEAAGVTGTEYHAKLVTLAAAGTPPDVLYTGLADMPSLVAKQLMRPLDDLIKADRQFRPDDFFPVHWNAWRFQGKQQGLPWQGGPLVTYYSQNLFEAAGAPFPTEASWTWEGQRDAGAKLKRSLAAAASVEPRWPLDVGPWQHWVYAAGADVLDKTMTRCLLDSPQALAGFQTMVDFIHRDQIAPRPQDTSGKTPAQLFMESRLAAIVMNRQGSSVPGFVQPHVAIAPLPRGPAGRFSQSPFDGFALGNGTKEPAAAWEVLKFRTGDRLRRLLHSRGLGGIPALKATAASPEYLDERLPREWNQFFVETMATVRLAPPTPKWTDVVAMVGQTVQQLLRGEVAPAPALRDLVPRVNALLQAP